LGNFEINPTVFGRLLDVRFQQVDKFIAFLMIAKCLLLLSTHKKKTAYRFIELFEVSVLDGRIDERAGGWMDA
jgi:hypothetical protein